MRNKIIPNEIIENKIYLIRGKKVMFDDDLARLYGVQVKVLNQAAKRNAKRFPVDFMFQLTKQEAKILKSQSVISDEILKSRFVTSRWGGKRKLPYVFTEQGVAMLSSVLRSERAIRVNIQIMRTFTKIREMVASNRALREKIEAIERKCDGKFKIIFDAIKRLVEKDRIEPVKIIGFEYRKKK
ncbi:MAG: ORF6N domain-containing protein [Candidatus Moranbacteria bacterium]|nr:ORF6N domain-containing protein [Candidatus Moranbacteria bacterium]